MRAILTLQIPSDDLRRGRILVASSDPSLLRLVCDKLIAFKVRDLEQHKGNLFDRELARLELEQLRARLSFALSEEDSP